MIPLEAVACYIKSRIIIEIAVNINQDSLGGFT